MSFTRRAGSATLIRMSEDDNDQDNEEYFL